MTKFLTVLLSLACLSARAATTNVTANATEAAVQAMYTISAEGDTVAIPDGSSATWSTVLNWTKGVNLQGVGTNVNITIAVTGNNFNNAGLVVNHNSPMLLQRINFHGDGTHGAIGVGWSPGGGRITQCSFSGFNIALYDNNSFGVIDHSTFSDNQVSVRVNGAGPFGCQNWNTYYPIPFNSTNYWFIEDCAFDIPSSFGSGSHAYVSSGQGSSYVVRHSTFRVNADQMFPCFDWHGDQATDNTRGNLSAQIYANTFSVSGSGSIGLFVDARGGQSQVYSNVITGGVINSGIRYREEWPAGSTGCGPTPVFDVVTNAWDCSNTWNGTPFVGFCNPGDNCGMLSYHPGTCFTPYTAPVYPHPLDTGGGLPPPPPTPGNITFAASGYTYPEPVGGPSQAPWTLNRSAGTDGAVTATVYTLDGTAKAGHDYTTNSTTVTWAAGATGARSAAITLLASGDTATTNRQLTLVITNITGGATLTGPVSIPLTITMQPPVIPPPPTNGGSLQLSSAQYSTTNSSGSVTITVLSAGSTNIARTVHYSTLNGSAVAGTDYTATSGTLSWLANDNTPRTFNVNVINTGAIGGNPRLFTVKLDTPTGGAGLGLSHATVSIAPTPLVGVQINLKLSGSTVISGSVKLNQ